MSKLKIWAYIILSTFIPQLSAAVFCVTNSEELSSALLVAGVNGQSDDIRIRVGTYQVPTTQGFRYLEHPSENFTIEISGGWIDFVDPCGAQYQSNPFGTTLDGNGQQRVLEMVPNVDTDIKISKLNFINGYRTGPLSNTDFTGYGSGLLIDAENELDGDITIENNTFVGNTASDASALLISNAEKVILRNNLFTENISELSNYSIKLKSNAQTGFYVTNNTIMFNKGGLDVLANGTTKAFVANNLIWGNEPGRALLLTGLAEDLFLYNNNFTSYIGPPLAESNAAGNISFEPNLEAGSLNFTPSLNSPLVGAGRNKSTVVPIPTPFQYLWSEGEFDFEGNVRNQGDGIDIGAVESPHQAYFEVPIFKNGFEAQE